MFCHEGDLLHIVMLPQYGSVNKTMIYGRQSAFAFCNSARRTGDSQQPETSTRRAGRRW